MKRFLQRHLKTPLARALLSGEGTEGAEAKFTVKADALAMK
ncbi:MAG: hypothetical protein HZA31_10045 [Opitutae bacterium]|nr:hypothetical protein [Opitutae bacterium]